MYPEFELSDPGIKQPSRTVLHRGGQNHFLTVNIAFICIND